MRRPAGTSAAAAAFVAGVAMAVGTGRVANADAWVRPARDRFALAAAVQVAAADDSSIWRGAALTGCGRWRSICLGGRLDAMWEGARDGDQVRVVRRDVGALIVGTKSAPVGRIHLALDVGGGVGLTTARRVVDGLVRSSLSPRVALGARAGLPLSRWVAIEVRAGTMLAPLAHHDAYIEGNDVALPGDPVVRFELSVGMRIGMP